MEGVFSIFKRVFGEHILALKWENIVHDDYKVTKIQDPYQMLRSIIKKEPIMTDTLTFSWADWKDVSGNMSG